MAKGSGLLYGLSEARDAVKEQASRLRRPKMQTDGGDKRSRLKQAARGAQGQLRRLGSEARQGAERGGRVAIDALGSDDLARQRTRRFGIAGAGARESREQAMFEGAAESATVGPTVDATLDPLTSPEDVQYATYETGGAAGDPRVDDLVMSSPRDKRGQMSGIDVVDSLGVGVGSVGPESGDDEGEWMEFESGFFGGEDDDDDERPAGWW